MNKPKVFSVFTTLFFLALVITGCNPAMEINVPCSAGDLIQAINTANANSNTTILNLDANCAYNFTNADNSDGGHGFNALPIITTPIRINGNNATLRRTSAAIREFRFFLITDTGGLRLDEMTLAGGISIEPGDDIEPGGGAIYNDGGSLTVNQVQFQNNHNLSNGGAILNLGILIIDNGSQFEGNHAINGGAIYNAGYLGSPITINNTTFTLGFAGTGGAIYNRDAEAEFLIGNVDFLHNTSAYKGGAIYAEDGRFTIVGSTFEENGLPISGTGGTTPPDHGGAIFIEDGIFDISKTLFELNQSAISGGAINNANGTLTLQDEITFYYNTASVQPPAGNLGHGGGIYNEAGSVDISNTYFIENIALGMGTGGAVYNEGNAFIQETALASNSAYNGGAINNRGLVAATNVSFSSNVAQNGANIFNAGDLSLSFATLKAGTADRGESIFRGSGNIQIKNSILYNPTMHTNCDGSGGSFQALGDNIDNFGDCPGITTHQDPLLDAFANYGGYTPTFALLPGSPAIDAVSNCTDVASLPVTQDQRGISRPQPSGGVCDIGAYEEETQSLPPSPEPTQESTATPTPEPLVPMLFAPQNTTCRKGDSTEYKDAGYLLAGESAEVIGRNQDATWLVINNPDWGGICWILRAIVETEGDVDGTKVYIPAPLPTKTPTQVLGCLVQTERGGDPVCTVPCPDGATPGDPCTP